MSTLRRPENTRALWSTARSLRHSPCYITSMPSESDKTSDNEQYPTNTTERLADEPSCNECGKDVTEWAVSFEMTIHDESGYSKRHRCPHCGELCFKDAYEGEGWAIFWVTFFPACVPWFWILSAFFGPLEADDAGDLHGVNAIQAGVAIALGFATAYVVMRLVLRLYRRWARTWLRGCQR